MSYLKFVEYKKSEDAELFTIADGLGNSILMPKLGYLNWREKKILAEYMATVTKKIDILIPQVEFEIAALLTKERLKIDANVPNEQIMTDEQGEPISDALVKEIYEFFIKEQLKWDEKAIARWKAQVEAEMQLGVDRAIANWEAGKESSPEERSEILRDRSDQTDQKTKTKKGFSK